MSDYAGARHQIFMISSRNADLKGRGALEALPRAPAVWIAKLSLFRRIAFPEGMRLGLPPAPALHG